MKTKYILHGGFTSHINAENDKFFKEILKDSPDNPKVLLVYFAKEKEEVLDSKTKTIAQFEKNKGNKNLSFEIADEKQFEEQIKKADIIYLHGGNTLKLLNALKKFSNLKKLFNEKTIAGESAGAYVLSTYFYNAKENRVSEGLGFVPVKIICHWTEERKDRLNELNKCSANLEILLLPDYHYKVFQ